MHTDLQELNGPIKVELWPDLETFQMDDLNKYYSHSTLHFTKKQKGNCVQTWTVCVSVLSWMVSALVVMVIWPYCDRVYLSHHRAQAGSNTLTYIEKGFSKVCATKEPHLKNLFLLYFHLHTSACFPLTFTVHSIFLLLSFAFLTIPPLSSGLCLSSHFPPLLCSSSLSLLVYPISIYLSSFYQPACLFSSFTPAVINLVNNMNSDAAV